MKENRGYVYMMSNKPKGIIYIGATIDYGKRGQEHRTKMLDGFTKRYNLTRLVWIEEHETAAKAFAMETKLKNLSRKKKIEMIERDNPMWCDLFNSITEGDPVLTPFAEAKVAPQDW